MKDDVNYVGHIVDCARRVQQFAGAETREMFDANEVLRLAIVHLIQTMGEAARLVSPVYRAQHAAIPWQQIIGMRNRIVHDYLNIDYDIVWQVAKFDVANLIAQLAPLVPDDPDTGS